MASDHLLGYQCEFIDTVLDNFYCKKCSLVARRLTFTSCCVESYCHACVADIQQQDIPCLECGHQNFTTIKPLKYQRQMDCLKVYCSMRGRGCGWSGTLGQLDAHLDLDQNNCQHVDIKCPLHCQLTIPKNKVVHHMAMECVKRDHVCQYCHLKATYEVMVDTHWLECIYFPLQCPNFCGVTCEHDVMKDHMRICRLEGVACDFSGVGCDGRFRREDQEEHARQNSKKHLTLTADAAVKMSHKLIEQEEKLKKQEEKLQEHEKRFQEQERKLQEEKQKTEKELRQQEQKFEKKFEEQEQKFKNNFQEQMQKFHKQLQEQDKKFVELQEKSHQNKIAVKEITNFSLKRTFTMENFSKEKEKDKFDDWKSPAMYTHVCGYKFCIGIDANGCGSSHGKAIVVDLYVMQGLYDHQLKWPAHASFTIELLNQHGRENIICNLTQVQWQKPTTTYVHIYTFTHIQYDWVFLEHSKLTDFLADDMLYFHLSNITVY